MDNNFNFSRFGLLIRRQWLDLSKIYLVSLLVVIGLVVGFYWFNTFYQLRPGKFPSASNLLNFRLPIFSAIGFLFITISASNQLAYLGNKQKAIMDLLIPASAAEKFWAALFYSIILCVTVYLAAFFAIDYLFVYKLKQVLNVSISGSTIFGNFVENPLKFFHEIPHFKDFVSLSFLPFLLSSFFLLGSIYFKSYHYLKTIFMIIVFFFAWGYLFISISEKFFFDTVWVGSYYWQSEEIKSLWVFLIGIVITLLSWIVTYVRLKEKEV